MGLMTPTSDYSYGSSQPVGNAAQVSGAMPQSKARLSYNPVAPVTGTSGSAYTQPAQAQPAQAQPAQAQPSNLQVQKLLQALRERFNQRGMPAASRFNLGANQVNTWQQRMWGRQGGQISRPPNTALPPNGRQAYWAPYRATSAAPRPDALPLMRSQY